MKFAVFAIVTVAVLAAPLTELQKQSHFADFITKFEKKYSADEFLDRFNVFKTNTKLIEDHNAGDHTFSMGMNEFGDLTFEEFKARYTGFAGPQRAFAKTQNLHKPLLGEKIADSVDWTDKGAVTPVKKGFVQILCFGKSTLGSSESSVAGFEFFKSEITEFVHTHRECVVTSIVIFDELGVGLENVESVKKLIGRVFLFELCDEISEVTLLLKFGQRRGKHCHGYDCEDGKFH